MAIRTSLDSTMEKPSCRSMIKMADYIHRVAPRVRLADHPMQMRVGMAMGPVVGGVIGVSKFAYDYWGDTVNEASRMESTGVPGATQVSMNIYQHLKEEFVFESHRVTAKGKGELDTFVHHPVPRSEMSGNLHSS
eukprot:NODE_6425_length_511_cov_81.887446_g5649_i0.p1 GENE.NODE_6425_length_511_cov_81.887446_g5649_i0~~NODE_6425_length_511_cov_81.887446_g5649_i0.p1  ORF type:complete len:135 (-),score=21.24 NODE_6425_length_511_cov_81.887446_g5649_i0:36-440(-)